MVERFATDESRSGERHRAVAGEFGVANVLNLLKLGVRGEQGSRDMEATAQRTESERYHTYGSLLYRLRRTLAERDAIKLIDASPAAWESLTTSSFVEISGVFRPNPLAHSLQTVIALLNLARMTAGMNGSSGAGQRKAQKTQAKELDQLRKFLEGILSDMASEDVNLFVVDASHSPPDHVVVALFSEYLRDRSLTELSQGEFRLLGKVVRKLTTPEEYIDLLRGTALGSLSEDILAELLQAFEQAESEGLRLPEVETRVSGPALQVVPIGIYV